jgi:HD-GYP domain-containing protein (c-di-GMP phosphodiesterase class II)
MARICAIADAFDRMVSDRSYREGKSFDAAAKELLINCGIQFDKYYVDIFLNSLHLFLKVYPMTR